MDKKSFIQHASIAYMCSPHIEDIAKDRRFDFAISVAEAHWEKLSERGYGAVKRSEPRDNVSYYQQMTEDEQKAFDKCWHKYGREGARDAAAKAWMSIEQSEREKIYPAMCVYLEKIFASGTAKAHFSTFLNGRYWEGLEQVKKEKQKAAFNPDLQELAYLEKQLSIIPETQKQAIEQQIQKLKDKMKLSNS